MANAFRTLALLGGTKLVTERGDEGWRIITDHEKKAVMALLDKGTVTIVGGTGVIREFEEKFSKFQEAKFALAMNSGTATLHSAYFAVGIGPACEVIVPSYTWHATITPILHCAATPVFCDIDPRTLTADPKDIRRRITPRTKAIVVVHTWGNIAQMDEIMAIAREHNLKVVEDCSHAHGGSYKGKKVGTFGDIGCFSLQGNKPVSGGEAGVAITDNPEYYDRMLLLGHFGRIASEAKTGLFKSLGDMSLGAKYRPHAYAMAIANAQLDRLPELNRLRTHNYRILNEELRGIPGIETVEPLPGAQRAGFLEFKLIYDPRQLQGVGRDRFAEAVKAEGAPMTVDRYSSFNYTYGLLHLAPLFNEFDRSKLGGCFYDFKAAEAPGTRLWAPGSLPVTEDIGQRLLTFPAFTQMPEPFIRQCAQAVRKVATHIEELKQPA